MGAIWFRTREFGGILGEAAGYRSGLALTEARLRELLKEGDFGELWPEADEMMRIRSEEFEEVHWYLLYRLGVASSPHFEPNPVGAAWRRAKDEPLRAAVFEPVAEAFTEFLGGQIEPGGVIDPRPFVVEMTAVHGPAGGLVALDLMKATAEALHNSPWNPARRQAWKDIRDLEELFRSERLDGPHGTYFDQRFANFLGANFDAIDDINWRQFEGLAAEYFKREGFVVELGPGRGDGGVDIRLWPNGQAQESAPAAVLVQCKRERRKISNTVVKALWADVAAEGAGTGLIVTTSALSPSADAIRTARNYDISDAHRDTLKEWVEALRTPGTGFFLAE
jgi:restriction system protein